MPRRSASLVNLGRAVFGAAVAAVLGYAAMQTALTNHDIRATLCGADAAAPAAEPDTALIHACESTCRDAHMVAMIEAIPGGTWTCHCDPTRCGGN